MATVKSEKINQGRREKSFQRSFSDMFWFALYLLVLLVAAIHLPKSVTIVGGSIILFAHLFMGILSFLDAD